MTDTKIELCDSVLLVNEPFATGLVTDKDEEIRQGSISVPKTCYIAVAPRWVDANKKKWWNVVGRVTFTKAESRTKAQLLTKEAMAKHKAPKDYIEKMSYSDPHAWIVGERVRFKKPVAIAMQRYRVIWVIVPKEEAEMLAKA